jgi:hypothetical protein
MNAAWDCEIATAFTDETSIDENATAVGVA